MHPFLVSLVTVGLGEIGDKTQLLALLLAVRYRRPYIILLGILVATVLNHLLAAIAGEWLRSLLTPAVLRWGLGLSLLAVAAWTLKPDQMDEEDTVEPPRHGLFLADPGVLLCRRDRRQNPDRHRPAGGALQPAAVGGGGHHPGHDAGELTRGAARSSPGRSSAPGVGAARRRPCCSACRACWCCWVTAAGWALSLRDPSRGRLQFCCPWSHSTQGRTHYPR